MSLADLINGNKTEKAANANLANSANQARQTVAKMPEVPFLERVAEGKHEERRKKVLAMLADKPDSQRAIITDMNSDRDNAILTIAIRDQYSFEILIPKGKYDAFALLKLIEKGSMQCP